MNTVIIDNYLSEETYKIINEYIKSEDFKWNLIERANPNSTEDQFQFLHMFVNYWENIYTNSNNIVLEIMKPLKKDKSFLINRAKANLFVKTKNEHQKLGFHKDIFDGKIHNIKTLLYYLDDSNGYTEFKTGEKIESKKNRAVVFDSWIEHQTVTQTDNIFRYNININYKEIQ